MSEVEPEAAPAEGGEAAPAEAEPWAGPDQETWEQTQQTLQEQQAAIEYFTQLAQPQSPFQQQQAPEQPEFDPLADNATEQLRQVIQAELAPYSEYVQAQQYREGEARAQDILSDIVARDGDFVFAGSKEQARTLANSFIGQTNQQFPNDPAKAAEQAIEMAAKHVREWETNVGKAYHEQQINQLGQLGGARREQGVNADGTQMVFPGGGGLVDVAYRHGEGR